MAKYRYDDFERKAREAGVMGRFDPKDIQTAQTNPEYGLAMVNVYQQEGRARTPEQRLIAQESGRMLRKSYGLQPPPEPTAQLMGAAPSSAVPAAAPVVAPAAASAPAAGQTPEQQALADWQYVAESDPAYIAMLKRAQEASGAAAENTMGAAAAMTGGRPSSYAVSASQQAAQQPYETLAMAVPGLEQNAYQRLLGQVQLQMQQDQIAQQQANREEDIDRAEANRKEEIDRQNAQLEWEKAMKLWSVLGTADENIAAILGVPVGTPYGPARAAGGGGSRGPGGPGQNTDGPGSDQGQPPATVEDIATDYPGGYVEQDDWDYLVDIYGEDALRKAGLKPDLPVDMESVRALGLPNPDPDTIRYLVETGRIEEYEEDGMLKYRRIDYHDKVKPNHPAPKPQPDDTKPYPGGMAGRHPYQPN